MGWKLTAGVRWLRVDDGTVVFVPDRQRFIELDSSGADLLEFLHVCGWDASDAAELLLDTYELTPAVAANIVEAFLRDFEQRGALTQHYESS